MLLVNRFAARKGMWGFVKAMSPFVQQFVKERRMICEPVRMFFVKKQSSCLFQEGIDALSCFYFD